MRECRMIGCILRLESSTAHFPLKILMEWSYLLSILFENLFYIKIYLMWSDIKFEGSKGPTLQYFASFLWYFDVSWFASSKKLIINDFLFSSFESLEPWSLYLDCLYSKMLIFQFFLASIVRLSKFKVSS